VGKQVPGGVLSWNRIKTRKDNHNGDVLGYGEVLFFNGNVLQVCPKNDNLNFGK